MWSGAGSCTPPPVCGLAGAPGGMLASDPGCTACPYSPPGGGTWSGDGSCTPPPPSNPCELNPSGPGCTTSTEFRTLTSTGGQSWYDTFYGGVWSEYYYLWDVTVYTYDYYGSLIGAYVSASGSCQITDVTENYGYDGAPSYYDNSCPF